MKFLYVAKYRMKVPEASGLSGAIIMPSGIARPTLERRKFEKYDGLSTRYLDPQLYLQGLNAAQCTSPCVNLASYGWFPGKPATAYDSAELTQKQWKDANKTNIFKNWNPTATEDPTEIEDACRIAAEVQSSLECAGILLPSPLTTELNSDLHRELAWLDAGLEVADRVAPRRPRFATIAISDTALRLTPPEQNQLIDLVLDQVSARAPEGVYIVIEQANENGYFCTHPNTVGGLFRLVKGFATAGIANVVTAYCGIAGLACLALGASAWACGWYRSERRLKLADFELNEGRAMPAYYSHRLCGEIHLQSDLDRIAAAGKLELVADATEASRGLLNALRQGKKTADVPAWEYRQTNITASMKHFFASLARETGVLASLTEQQRVEHVRTWLAEASNAATELYTIGNFHQRTSLEHQAAWSRCFEEVVRSG